MEALWKLQLADFDRIGLKKFHRKRLWEKLSEQRQDEEEEAGLAKLAAQAQAFGDALMMSSSASVASEGGPGEEVVAAELGEDLSEPL